MLRKKSYIVTLLLLLGGCGSYTGTDVGLIGNYLDKDRPKDSTFAFGGSMSPRPLMLRGLPGGDDSYSVGFRDGCSTSLNFGVGLVRSHPFSYDIVRGLKDREYYAGYRAGTVYCVYFSDVDPL